METEDAARSCSADAAARARVVTISQVSAGRKNRLSWEIDGSESALAWHSEAPEELWLGHRDRPSELLAARGAATTRPATPRASPTPSSASTAPSTRRSDGGPPDEPDYPTFADGHEEALIGDAIARRTPSSAG